MTWQTISVMLCIIGLAVVAGGARSALRGRPGRGASGMAAGLILALLGFSVAFLGAGLRAYTRLSYETPIAEVRIQALDPSTKRYQVTLHRLDGAAAERTCDLQGDEWLLSARVQTWKPWANIVGVDATYLLEQIANRYISAAEANANRITACDLAEPTSGAVRLIPQSWQAAVISVLQAEDRRFGSANYMPLADGAVYEVFMTQSGLNAEPANAAARMANEARP